MKLITKIALVGALALVLGVASYFGHNIPFLSTNDTVMLIQLAGLIMFNTVHVTMLIARLMKIKVVEVEDGKAIDSAHEGESGKVGTIAATTNGGFVELLDIAYSRNKFCGFATLCGLMCILPYVFLS